MESLTFRSKHSYSDARVGIEIPIGLTIDGPPRSVRLLANVDTGASFCIFQREYAEQLGIHVESGQYQEVRTAAGPFGVFGHTVKISCLDWEFEATVFFAESPEFTRNVVGRAGWLQHFRLGLIDHDAMLYLSHYDD